MRYYHITHLIANEGLSKPFLDYIKRKEICKMNYYELSKNELEEIKEQYEINISDLMNAKEHLQKALNDILDIEECDDLIGYLEECIKEAEYNMTRISDEISSIIKTLQDSWDDDYNERQREYREMQGF